MADPIYLGEGPQGPLYLVGGRIVVGNPRTGARSETPTDRVRDRVSSRTRNTLDRNLTPRERGVTGYGLGGRPALQQASEFQYGPPREPTVEDLAERDVYGGYLGESPFGQEGVPSMEGYYPQTGYFAGGVYEDPATGEVTYVAGDADEILDGMDPAMLLRLQERMVAAGIAGKGLVPGMVDQSTLQAFESLLALSNRAGMDWNSALAQTERAVAEHGLLGDEEVKFTAPSYMAPDYATLAETVRDKMRSALGRDPDDSEMAQLVGELQGWDREAYEADVAAARSDFDAAQAGAPGGATVEAVDPLARFSEAFRQRYASEIDFVEERDEVTPVAQASIQGGVGTLSDMSRGG